MTIDPFDLISGQSIVVNNACTIRQPTLNDIRKIGYSKYNNYMSMLLMDVNTFQKSLNIEDIFNDLPEEERKVRYLHLNVNRTKLTRDA